MFFAIAAVLISGCADKVTSPHQGAIDGRVAIDGGNSGDSSTSAGYTGGFGGAGGGAGKGGQGGAGGSGGGAGASGGGGSTVDSGANDGGAGGSGGGAGASGGGGSTTDGGANDSDAGSCDKTTCENSGFSCCGNQCVNLDNDINNCGSCGNQCQGAAPYCGSGVCSKPPCNGAACTSGYCCGDACCTGGQLCCNVPGPVETLYPSCTAPSDAGTCPRGCKLCVCASPDTPIATPEGDRSMALIEAGDLVYSLNHGRIEAVPVLRTIRTAVSNHRVKRVALANGSVLEISAGHPTADGRTFADLQTGDLLGGVELLDIASVEYSYPFTYDILPDSDTGTYLAGGALIGSTLTDRASSACIDR